MEERALTEELIRYDTSREEGIKLCAGFVKGWLEARDIEARQVGVQSLPMTMAEIGPPHSDLTLLLHGHIDVVPGLPGQFEPRVEGERLYGRGAYDMKGALASMLLAFAELARRTVGIRVRLGIVPDEESEEEEDERGAAQLVSTGFVGDFAITGAPTDMQVGVAAKGVLAMRLAVSGRAAHGATPWLGENAILRAYDVFRQLESLPFASESSALFDRPSINLGRILGGDALNKVPDACVMDVVGRDGASDAATLLRAGVATVEFGPHGGGHHGPEEWVSIPSLASYRQSIVDYVQSLPGALGAEAGEAE